MKACHPKIRELIDGLQAVHRTNSYDANWKAKAAAKPAPHRPASVVRVHPETGKNTCSSIRHLLAYCRPREREARPDRLWPRRSAGRNIRCASAGRRALVIWDNQATAHAGPIDYAHFKAPRVVRRITVAICPKVPTAVSRPLEGELFGTIDWAFDHHQRRPENRNAIFGNGIACQNFEDIL